MQFRRNGVVKQTFFSAQTQFEDDLQMGGASTIATGSAGIFKTQSPIDLILQRSSTTKLTLGASAATFVDTVSAPTYFATGIKSGATQGAAGAAADEMWKTASHATLPDNVVMIGV
jgi:hypothetical protein